MEGEAGGGSVTVRGRVEIDTRQPFRSVREAVMLFGEKILAGEVYGNKLKEMQIKANKGQVNQPQKLLGATMTAELEETKQSLQKAREDGNLMAHCLTSLRQELENTKRELHQLKSRPKSASHDSDLNDEPEIEEIKFVENSTRLAEAIKPPAVEDNSELRKKRSVKFASPSLLTKTIITSGEQEIGKVHSNSSKKTKKKPLVPLIGGLFQKKK